MRMDLLKKFGLNDYKPVCIPLIVNDKLKKDDDSEPTIRLFIDRLWEVYFI